MNDCLNISFESCGRSVFKACMDSNTGTCTCVMHNSTKLVLAIDCHFLLHVITILDKFLSVYGNLEILR